MRTVLHEIFDGQEARMINFGNLQHDNKCHELRDHACSTNREIRINERPFQMLCRRYAWQITEEIVESFYETRGTPQYLEEVADVFHFMVELCLQLQITPEECLGYLPKGKIPSIFQAFHFASIQQPAFIENTGEEMCFRVIDATARAMNLLKNRPWRTDDRPTDWNEFFSAVLLIFDNFFQLLVHQGVTHDQFLSAFARKAAINNHRYNEMSAGRSPA